MTGKLPSFFMETSEAMLNLCLIVYKGDSIECVTERSHWMELILPLAFREYIFLVLWDDLGHQGRDQTML